MAGDGENLVTQLRKGFAEAIAHRRWARAYLYLYPLVLFVVILALVPAVPLFPALRSVPHALRAYRDLGLASVFALSVATAAWFAIASCETLRRPSKSSPMVSVAAVVVAVGMAVGFTALADRTLYVMPVFGDSPSRVNILVARFWDSTGVLGVGPESGPAQDKIVAAVAMASAADEGLRSSIGLQRTPVVVSIDRPLEALARAREIARDANADMMVFGQVIHDADSTARRYLVMVAATRSGQPDFPPSLSLPREDVLAVEDADPLPRQLSSQVAALAHFVLGRAYCSRFFETLEQDDLSQALVHFEKILGTREWMPTSTDAARDWRDIRFLVASCYLLRAHTLPKTNAAADLQTAKTLYEQSRAQGWDSAGVHNNLGLVLLALGDLQGAEQEFRTGLEHEPQHPGLLGNLQKTLDLRRGQ